MGQDEKERMFGVHGLERRLVAGKEGQLSCRPRLPRPIGRALRAGRAMKCQLIAEDSRPGPALRSFLGELMIAKSGLLWLWRCRQANWSDAGSDRV